jgi:hypothetical protein
MNKSMEYWFSIYTSLSHAKHWAVLRLTENKRHKQDAILNKRYQFALGAYLMDLQVFGINTGVTI